MRRYSRIFLAVSMLTVAAGYSMAQNNLPQIGVLYPAGGQRGTTFTMTVSGQFIRPMNSVYISGEGITAEVVGKAFVPNNINKEQRYMIARALLDAMKTSLDAEGVSGDKISAYEKQIINRPPFNTLKDKKIDIEGEKAPKHPLLFELEAKSPPELIHAKEVIFRNRRFKQKNRQLAESVMIKVTIAPEAKPGARTLRLLDKNRRASNQMTFYVDDVPEKIDAEPNDIPATQNRAPATLDAFKPKVYAMPFIMNGRILPGDVDHFKFKANEGDKVLIDVSARILVPYLADAVPGWFQAVVALYDADGKQVAYADDHLFSPDPVIYYEVPNTGEYEIEIRDSIYRGREDFVYRVSVKNAPESENEFVSGSTYGDSWSRRAVTPSGMTLSELIPKDVASLPSSKERAVNNSIKQGQPVKMPLLIDASISEPGDVDVFKVNASAPGKIAVELFGRRLGSPIDSFVKVTDKDGKIIASNDDYVAKDKHLHLDAHGLITHMADSRLIADLPAKGEYFVHVSDVTRSGGPKYGYRLRISEPMPGFVVRATPSLLSMRWRDCVPINLHVDRRDGYDGPIKINVKAPSEGFSISGGDIPAGAVSWVMSLTSVSKGTGVPIDVELEAQAEVNDATISSAVIPADRVMQAFLFEHLVPTAHLPCAVRKEKWGVPVCRRVGEEAVSLIAGGTTTLMYKTAWKPKDLKLEVVVEQGPAGIEVKEAPKLENSIFSFSVNATDEAKRAEGNMLLSVWGSKTTKDKKGKPRTDRWRIRYLPVIPIAVKADATPVASTK